MNLKQRTASLLDVALDQAKRIGVHALTHASIAVAADVSPSLVKVRLGTITDIRRAVMRLAVARRCTRVVAEGLLAGSRIARRADESLRGECAELVYCA